MRRFLIKSEDDENSRLISQSFQTSKKEPEQGNEYYYFNLAHYYETGLGVDIDLQQAVKWYLESAKQGNPVSQLKLKELKEGHPEIEFPVS